MFLILCLIKYHNQAQETDQLFQLGRIKRELLLHETLRRKELKISVILTAYDRKTYINQAIKSVSEQTLGHSEFEVIIVSNFEVSRSHCPPDLQVSNVLMGGTMGEFLYAGIIAAKSDIIAFLDDDDTWDRNHLKEILSAFDSKQQISYYHNSERYIDRTGQEISVPFQNPRRTNNRYYKISPSDRKNILKLINMGAGFNLSSIAVLKSKIYYLLPVLQKILTNPDGLFFWGTIITGGEIYLNNKKLTSYRAHTTNISMSNNSEMRALELSRQMETFHLLEKLCDTFENDERLSKVRKFLRLQVLVWGIHYLMYSNGSRRQVIHNQKEIAKHWRYFDYSVTLGVLLRSVFFIVHPNLLNILNRLVSFGGIA